MCDETQLDTWARGEVIRSTGHGFSGIARVALLDALASRCEALGVALHFRSEMTHDALPGADVIVAAVTNDPALDPTEGIVYPESTADRLLTAAKFVQWAGFVLIGILLLAAVLLIGNTIRLSIFARRREVEVMRLVGATNWFIRWPFMIEGVICGLVGAVVAVGMLWGIKVGVVDAWAAGADTALTKTGSAAGTIAFPLLTVVLVGAGALLGAVGSGITLRRFLKV